jgi:hypothetical protein
MVWLRVYTLAFICGAATIAISAVLPTAGSGRITADCANRTSAGGCELAGVLRLRDGSFRALRGRLRGHHHLPGLHAALAVILIGAVAALAALRDPGLECKCWPPPDRQLALSVDVLAGIAVRARAIVARAASHGPRERRRRRVDSESRPGRMTAD